MRALMLAASHAQPAEAARAAIAQSQLAWPSLWIGSPSPKSYITPAISPKSGGPSRQTSLLSLRHAADRKQSTSRYETNATLGLRFEFSGADQWKREVVKGVLVEWANELPAAHFLPIDHTIHGAEADKPEVRTVIHLHGAKAPPESDGYPENWYMPGKSALYHYPNNQDAAMLWYHDHALGN